MALERIERKPAIEKAGLKKLEAGGIAKRKLLNSALDFVQSENDGQGLGGACRAAQQ